MLQVSAMKQQSGILNDSSNISGLVSFLHFDSDIRDSFARVSFEQFFGFRESFGYSFNY